VLPVAPVDHSTTPSQPVAKNVTLSPGQIEEVLQLITGTDGVETVTVTLLDVGLVHLFSTVQTALNTVVELTGTVILLPVMPLDHTTVPLQPVAVSVTLLPAHTEGALADTTGVLGSITVTVLLFDGALVQSPTLQMAV
jgi:hypothetical protein